MPQTSSIGTNVAAAWAGLALSGTAAFLSFRLGSSVLDGNCLAAQPPVWMFAVLILLPLTGGLLSYRAARREVRGSGLSFIARLGADFSLFIAALILLHIGYVLFHSACP